MRVIESKFYDICALHDLKFCYKRINHILQEYIYILLIFCHYHQLSIIIMKQDKYIDLDCQQYNHKFAKKSIKYRYINNLNNMSVSNKEKQHTHSQDGFKRYIKFSMIATYNERCDIHNCYICSRSNPHQCHNIHNIPFVYVIIDEEHCLYFCFVNLKQYKKYFMNL